MRSWNKQATFVAMLLLLLALAFAVSDSTAGTIGIRWTPVETSASNAATGYRVYYGTSTGNYADSVDTGLVTETTVSGLADCTDWFLAVKAFNSTGESPAFSNEVSGWPRPVLSTITCDDGQQPAVVYPGQTTSCVIAGNNFQAAPVVTATGGVEVTNVVVPSCTQVAFTIAVPVDMVQSAIEIEVVNPDNVYGAAPVDPGGADFFAVVGLERPSIVIGVGRSDVREP